MEANRRNDVFFLAKVNGMAEPGTTSDLLPTLEILAIRSGRIIKRFTNPACLYASIDLI